MNNKGLQIRGNQRTARARFQDENGDTQQKRLSYSIEKYTAREAQRAYVADLAKINAGNLSCRSALLCVTT